MEPDPDKRRALIVAVDSITNFASGLIFMIYFSGQTFGFWDKNFIYLQRMFIQQFKIQFYTKKTSIPFLSVFEKCETKKGIDRFINYLNYLLGLRENCE